MDKRVRGATLRQWLHYLTGDRNKEAVALVDDVEGHASHEGGPHDASPHDASPPAGDTVAAADEAVRAAHGDLGVERTDEVAGPIATPDDVRTIAGSS